MSVKKIIDIFTQLAEMNKILNEPFKVRAYINAIGSLKKLPVNATFKSCEDLLSKYYLTGISIKGSLCKKIDEILETGHVKELDELANNDEIKRYRELMEVKDIGYALAKKLIEKHNVKSIADLRTKVKKGEITLTKNQTLGLVYHEQLNKRIPHAEVTKITNKLKSILKPLGVHIEITGSYRRGLPTSGDIDVLILPPKEGSVVEMKKIVDLLTKKQLLHEEYFSIGPTKFQGIVNSPVAHQIDIRLIPEESFATALLYFTGSKNFNQTMRQKAMKMGYKLSEYSLFNNRTNKKEKVKTEKDVFKILKMKYLPPSKRE